ncbi:MAG: UrcA family protein, partial [Sphingomonas sp.]
MKLVLAVLATALVATPVFATDADVFAKSAASFHVEDLDLATADGQARLSARLDKVAGDVCGRGMDRVHPTLAQQAALCRKDVIVAARSQIETR